MALYQKRIEAAAGRQSDLTELSRDYVTLQATYTGLLKLFLDRFAGGVGLRGVAVPLMLGAAPHHALAPELHLRPLLVELGASVPTSALYVLDREHDRPEPYGAWLVRSRPLVHAHLGPLLARTTGAPA